MNGNIIGKREPMTKEIVKMIIDAIGFGALILNLNLTDYECGAMTTKNGKCFWLTNGKRIDISFDRGTFVASITDGPDENKPKPLEKENDT